MNFSVRASMPVVFELMRRIGLPQIAELAVLRIYEVELLAGLVALPHCRIAVSTRLSVDIFCLSRRISAHPQRISSVAKYK